MQCKHPLFPHAMLAAWCVCLPLRADEEVQVRERVAPWGVVVSRERFYVSEGIEMLHGLQERFDLDGSVESRCHYAHDEDHGTSEFFYRGIGVKESELSYTRGEENGWFRTWGADGKLLFEGFSVDGKRQHGWFDIKSTHGGGLFHRHTASWTIQQWKNGKKIPGSTREVETSWRTWKPGTLPDMNKFLRWDWNEFEQQSDYPYLDRMPGYQDVPILIDYLEQKGKKSETATDQLQALTRVDFSRAHLPADEKEPTIVARWRAWWEDGGKHRQALQKTRGVRDEAAWNLVRRDRNLKVPEEPMLIPDAYVLAARYSSGDYGGVVSETVTIHRTEHGAELVRSFSLLSGGPVKKERWLPFDAGEADRLVRAIGYLVDQPWLFNDEAALEKRYWESEKKDPTREFPQHGVEEKLKGRESFGNPYHPSSDYELRDVAGKLWWNADPHHWYGGNPERFNQTHLPVSGIVYPFLIRLYPETSRADGKGKAGWSE